jgi:hypothetical protein
MAQKNFLDDYEDIDDIDVSSDVPEKFKVESKDATYRIAFPLLKSNGKVAIVPVSFYTFEDDDGDWHKIPVPRKEDGSVNEELNKQLAIHCGEVKTRWVTIILKYITKKDGKVSTLSAYDLLALPLAKKQVRALKNISEEYPLSEYDVKVSSDNPDFNDFSFVPSGKALYLTDKMPEGEADVIQEEAIKLAVNMTKIYAYPKTDAEIRKILELDDMDDDDEEFDGALDEDDEDFEEEPAPKRKVKKEEPAPTRRRPTKAPVDEDDEDEFED